MPRQTRRDIVLDTTATLLSAHGFAATGVRQVAERATERDAHGSA